MRPVVLIYKSIYIQKLIQKNCSLHLKFQEGNFKQLHVYMFQLQSTGKMLTSTVTCFSATLASGLFKRLFFWQNIYFHKFSIPWLWPKFYIFSILPINSYCHNVCSTIDNLGSIPTAGEQSVSPFIVSFFLKLPKCRCFWTFIISYEICGEFQAIASH